jgi:Fe-S oxidoreductase
MYLAKALLENQAGYTRELSELVYTCSACRGCDDLCMVLRSVNPDMPLSDIIRLMKYELVKRGFIPEKLKGLYHVVKETGGIPNNGKALDLSIPEKINGGAQADTVLYAGCFHTETQAHMVHAALSVLEKIGKPVGLFKDDGCCGSTLFDHGFWDELPGLVDATMEKMKGMEDKTFLFVNPHCQEFILNRYEMIASNYESVKGRHISELMAEALREGKLDIKEKGKVKVTYHDPCMLGRGLGIYNAPREVLSFFESIELVEMKRNREDAFCCGSKAVGKYFSNCPEGTAEERIREFKDTKADLLITACPYCKGIFQKVLDNEKDRVMDLNEFVDERTK